MDTLTVCDPEPVVMEGLRCLLESIDGPRVVAAETSVEDAVIAVRVHQPTILVVDKGFGISAVTDLVRLLSTAERRTAAIVWGATISESEALRFMQAGAVGVIRKSSSLAALTACIRAVTAGGTWMETDLTRDSRQPLRSGRSALTPREMQVVDLVERGFKNKEIGQSLGIRTGTVKIHLKHIFEKTGIRGRYGLAISGLKLKGLLAAVIA